MRPVKEKKCSKPTFKTFLHYESRKNKKNYVVRVAAQELIPHQKKRKKHVKLANHVSLQPHSLDESGLYLSTFKES
jgi:hypothetical protein